MAETTYSYTISTDLPGGAVNTAKLDAEIRAKSDITISLNRIDTSGDNIDVVFNAALPAADKTALDGDVTGPAGGLIANHDNSSSVQLLKINKLRNIGGEAARTCSSNLQLSGSNTNKYSQYDLPAGEKYQLQGVVAFWENCSFGDYAQMSIVLTAADTNPNAQHLSGVSVINLNDTGFGAYYDPINSNHMRMEIYNDAGVFLESISISSRTGDAITLESPISQNIETNYVLKASIECYCYNDTGFYLIGSGKWNFVQEDEVSVNLSGVSFLSRLFTGAGTGTRTLIANYIGRKAD